jgi:hypothetical protein
VRHEAALGVDSNATTHGVLLRLVRVRRTPNKPHQRERTKLVGYTTGPVTVGTTPTLIATIPQLAGTVPVTNTGSVTVFLGGPSVTAADGLPVLESAAVNVPASLSEDNQLFGIVASGTTTVNFLLPGSVE